MKLKIELKSDLCSYSGETFNSFIDTDVVYDEYGFPYIPAKRIKGCIREACLELVDFGVVDECIYNSLFGQGGNQSSNFYLDNAYLTKHDAMLADILMANDSVLTHPQRVLSLYTDTRTQTAMEDGVAKPESLRTMRVVKKGLVFEASLRFSRIITDEQTAALEKAISMVKHMGMSRSRGLGQVELSLMEGAVEQKEEFMSLTSEDGPCVRLDYNITLRGPMICKSDEGNQAVSQDYIAGSKVLGMLISRMGQDAYKELPEDVSLQVSNAYITNEGVRCTKISKSLQKVKDSTFAISNGKSELKVYDMVCDYNGKEQLTPAGRYYVTPDHNVQTVNMQIDYHHRRPEDKSVGRANGLDGSAFYQLESITAGQTFRGYILADRCTAQLLASKVPASFTTRMGYGRTSEYGMAEFNWTGCRTVKQTTKKIKGDFSIKLNSPLILYGVTGYPSSSSQTVEDYFCRLLGNDNLKLTKLFAEYVTIGGYNVTWNARKPMFTALAAGTVCCFHTDADIDATLIDGVFIGERTREGYGEIELYKVEGLQTALYKNSTDKNTAEHKPYQTEIIDELKMQTDILNLEMKGRELAAQIVRDQRLVIKDFGKKSDVDAIISKMILMFHGESSLEAFERQVKDIADENKRKKAIRIITPAIQLAGEYKGLLKDDKVYTCLMNAYLSQIKYLIRPSREERRAEA